MAVRDVGTDRLHVSQRAIQMLQPKIKELQDKHGKDRESLQKDVMELYRQEKVNPLMGCLPMFLQVPVFIGLLHVLRHLKPGERSETFKTLYGWSSGEFDGAVVARLFDAPIAAIFSSSPADLSLMGNADSTVVKIVSAILVCLMIMTTYLTQRQMIKKTGWNTDPQQRMMQKFMLYGIPFFTLTSGWFFPIGVIIYWVTNNAITLGQQYWVLHKYPPPSVATTKTVPFKSKPATTDGGKPSGLRAMLSRTKDDNTKANGAKPSSKGGTPTPRAIDGKKLAPRPGAKPINPKKGGAAKRQSG